MVNNTRSKDVKFLVAGEVNVLPAYTCPTKWSAWGNNTPEPVDVKDIVLKDSNGDEFNDATNQSRNQVQIKRLSTQGILTTEIYQYTTRQNRKWCKGTTELAADTFVLQPGEAFLINNTRSDIVTLELPSPIK